MRELFKWDSPLMQFLSRVMDLILLNICFILGSIPILTIGTSLTSMYSIAMKMARNEEGYITKDFWREWKRNFRQSTLVWIIMLAIAFLFWMEYRQIAVLPGTMKAFYRWFWAILFVMFTAGQLFLYPYMARFQDTVKNCIINSWKLAVLHPIYTVSTLAVTGTALFLTLWLPDTTMWMLLFWTLLGFSVFAYVESLFVKKYFAPYDETEERTRGEEK